MTKPQTSHPNSSSSEPGIERVSHIISKCKPKIRIIHLYSPEIIKTDAANFRELVQRLTGKPEDETKTPPTKGLVNLHPKKTMNMEGQEEEEEKEFKMGMKNEIRVKNEEEEEEGEEEKWRRSMSNEKFSGFFDEFSELDSFIEDLSVLPAV